jgi:hypothetical protein
MEYFPIGIATGKDFCNRDEERQTLAANVLGGAHTWLMSPRRLGKTSLITEVIREVGERTAPRVVSATADLLVVGDAAGFERQILEALGDLAGGIVPKMSRLTKVARYFTDRYHAEVVAKLPGLTLRLTPVGDRPVADRIVTALGKLDELAGREGVRAALVLDEFQQVATLPGNETLEAGVRHAAERTKHLTCVFSGSRKRLLAAIFEHPDRPLFQLCERLPLGLLPREPYREYLRERANARWGQDLPEETFAAIWSVLGGHPYYLNRLCRGLWQCPAPPAPEEVGSQWTRFVVDRAGETRGRLVGLSPNQRKVLAALARNPTDQPQSQAWRRGLGIAPSSLGQALEALDQQDLVHVDESGVHRLLDPVVEAFLRRE